MSLSFRLFCFAGTSDKSLFISTNTTKILKNVNLEDWTVEYDAMAFLNVRANVLIIIKRVVCLKF